MEQDFNWLSGLRSLKSHLERPKHTQKLANILGYPKSARAIANACGKNPYPGPIPCHRVIRSDGSLGGYSGLGGIETKRKLLEEEISCFK